MTPAEILAILKPWHERTADLEEKMNALRDLLDMAPENSFSGAVYAVVGGYTRMVAERLDWDAAMLEDWIFAHQLGSRPMHAGFPGEAMRTLSTVEQLAQFIADDHTRSVKEKS